MPRIHRRTGRQARAEPHTPNTRQLAERRTSCRTAYRPGSRLHTLSSASVITSARQKATTPLIGVPQSEHIGGEPANVVARSSEDERGRFLDRSQLQCGVDGPWRTWPGSRRDRAEPEIRATTPRISRRFRRRSCRRPDAEGSDQSDIRLPCCAHRRLALRRGFAVLVAHSLTLAIWVSNRAASCSCLTRSFGRRAVSPGQSQGTMRGHIPIRRLHIPS